ncbi:MAG: galactose mutarotase [Oscillospiraceae bacterium]|nr:galactose mutarotase [Oscillospiraceae bacterium]
MILMEPFGTTKKGEAVERYILTNKAGMRVSILSFGATVQSIFVPDKNGTLRDVALGYDTLEEYEADRDTYVGALVGRVANRIALGRFTLDGKDYTLAVNNGPNHLHGGLEGFERKVCRAIVNNDWLCFEGLSPDGEEGYGGTLRYFVGYHLGDDGALHILYRAETDAPTLVNLTNHSYFNLGGDAMEHTLQIFADEITENDETSIPTGRLLPVAGTAFDFTEPKAVGRDIDAEEQQIKVGSGYDHNFVLRGTGLRAAAKLYSKESGIAMTVETDRAGMQLYSANFFGNRRGKGNVLYSDRCALALETQGFPDAIHHENFPSVVLRPDEVYDSHTIYRFCVEEK